MALFMIRVELTNATWQDYVDLASNLARVQITDVIASDNGSLYKLPPAEYCTTSSRTAEDIRTLAVTAAMATGKFKAVVVTQSSSTVWQGLDRT